MGPNVSTIRRDDIKFGTLETSSVYLEEEEYNGKWFSSRNTQGSYLRDPLTHRPQETPGQFPGPTSQIKGPFNLTRRKPFSLLRRERTRLNRKDKRTRDVQNTSHGPHVSTDSVPRTGTPIYYVGLQERIRVKERVSCKTDVLWVNKIDDY